MDDPSSPSWVLVVTREDPIFQLAVWILRVGPWRRGYSPPPPLPANASPPPPPKAVPEAEIAPTTTTEGFPETEIAHNL